MRNFLRKFGLFFLMFLSVILTACQTTLSVESIVSIQVEGELPERLSIEGFTLSEFSILITKADSTTVSIPLTEAMISAEDLAKLETAGTHIITVTYLGKTTTFEVTLVSDDTTVRLMQIYDLGFSVGAITETYEEWLAGIQGTPGADGREVELSVNEGQIKWKYEGESTWTNLISVAALTGVAGEDGKQVLFQIGEGFLQWQYEGELVWRNLLSLTELTESITPTISISPDGYWIINDVKTEFIAVLPTPEIVTIDLTFDLEGGAFAAPGVAEAFVDLPKGNSVVLPIPVKTGWIFAGWFSGTTPNDGQFTNLTTLSRDLTLYARWELDDVALKALLGALSGEENATSFLRVTFSSLTETMGIEERTIKTMTNNLGQKIVDSFVDMYYFEEGINDGIVDGHDVFRSITMGDTLYFYRTGKGDTYYFDSMMLGKWGFIAVPETNYNYLNVDLFVKRPTEFVFDYTGAGQELYNFACALTQNESFDEEEIIITFNGTTEILKVQIPVLNDMTQEFEYMFTGEFSVSDLGTTIAEFPLSECRTLVEMEFAEYYEEKLSFIVETEASHAEFTDILDYWNNELSLAEDAAMLMSAYEEGYSALQDYNLIPDLLKIMKLEALSVLQTHLDLLTKTATSTSISALNIAMNQATLEIEAQTTIPDVLTKQEEGLAALDLAYVEDPEKVAFLESQGIFLDYLQELFTFLSNIAVGTNDQTTLTGICETGTVGLWDATETAQILSTMLSTLSALRAAGLTLDPLLTAEARLQESQVFYAEYLTIAEYFVEKGLPIPEDLTSYYTFNAEQALLADDYDFRHIISIGTTMIQKEGLARYKEVILAELAELFAEYSYTVLAETQTTLMADYEFTVETVLQEEFISYLDGLVTHFQSLESGWGLDPIRSYQISLLKTLETRLIELVKIASETSILSMQETFSTAEGLFKAESDLTLLDGIYATLLEEMESAYEPDLDKIQLQEAQKKALKIIAYYMDSYFLLEGSWFIDQDLQNGEKACRLAVYSAPDLDTVSGILDSFIEHFTSLSLTIDPSGLTTLISQLDDRVTGYLSFFTGEPLPDLSFYEEALLDLESGLLSFSDTLGLLADLWITFDERIVLEIQQEVQSSQEELYLYTEARIYMEDMSTLQEISALYWEALGCSTDSALQSFLLKRFTDLSNLFTLDPVRVLRTGFYDFARNMIEAHQKQVTQNSLYAMEDLYDNLVFYIEMETEEAAMELCFNDFYNQFLLAYEEDPVKGSFLALKKELQDNLQVFSYLASACFAEEDPALWPLDTLLVNGYYILEGSTNEEELSLAYSELLSELWVLFGDGEFLEPEFYEYNGDLIRSIQSDFLDYTQSSEPYMETALNDLYLLKDEAISALLAATLPQEVFSIYANYQNESAEILKNAYKAWMTTTLNTEMNYYFLRQNPENYSILTNDYTSLKNMVNNAFLENTYWFFFNARHLEISEKYENLSNPLKVAKRYAIEQIQNWLTIHYPNATDDSRTNLYTEQTNGYNAIDAAGTVEEVETALSVCLGNLGSAYVEDSLRAALSVAKESETKKLHDDVQFVISMSSDYATLIEWAKIEADYTMVFPTANTMAQLMTMVADSQSERDANPVIFDEYLVNDFRESVLSDVEDYYFSQDSATQIEFNDEYVLFQNDVNSAVGPYEIQTAWYTFVNLIISYLG